MKILGISPLDKDATASLVEDGRILYGAGEERFSRVKQHAGFPEGSVRAGLSHAGWTPEDIDVVAYPFLTWEQESRLIEQSLAADRQFRATFATPDLDGLLGAATRRMRERDGVIHGLRDPNERMSKTLGKKLFYRLAGGAPWVSRRVAGWMARGWARQAIADHRRFQIELERSLATLGILGKLKRFEHHFSHTANAYLASGYERALIVTLDGYGSGLAGSVGLGEGGKIQRLKALRFPHSLGAFYETVTSSLGYNPDRHAGKIVGLAAYGDPEVLSDVLLAFFERTPGDYRMFQSLNVYLSRYLSTRFSKIDLAAAYQHVLEVVACDVVRHWVQQTGCRDVVLSGGVTANVKMNQRIHELDEVAGTFVYPNMGDGGCGTGLGLYLSCDNGTRAPLRDAYLGPDFTDGEIRRELDRLHLPYREPGDLAAEIARRIHAGQVIARFRGRMEYGPRALGNRSVLYHARDQKVNHWLNQRLGRTEFMPFAPVTLWEARHRCYHGVDSAAHAAEFMTITFDCTEWMKRSCPAAVHVDGTARPQLIRRETNPEYYRIVEEYEKLSGIPCLINTSFNMHEEPIVCSPADAVRAFQQGRLDGLAIGPFLVLDPAIEEREAQTGHAPDAVANPGRARHG